MISLIKSIWRKLFPVKPLVKLSVFSITDSQILERGSLKYGFAYDPMLDEDKILKGEVESYFE